jgi:hypothetical protein
LYFWVFDGNVPNDTPLTSMDATFEAEGEGYIEYQSCLTGYPFTEEHTDWRTASMERRNSPTDINYIPEANDNVLFEEAGMKGMQVTQPFQNGEQENTMVFHVPVDGFKDIKFAFAAKDEGAADAIVVDYAISSAAQWTIQGLEDASLELNDDYQLYELDFTDIEEVNDNESLMIRLRFTGENMTASDGDRVTFNNISVIGTSLAAGTDDNEMPGFVLYPNPVHDVVNIMSTYGDITYKIYSPDGKLVKEGAATNNVIDMAGLQNGLYLLRLSSGGKETIKRVIKI